MINSKSCINWRRLNQKPRRLNCGKKHLRLKHNNNNNNNNATTMSFNFLTRATIIATIFALSGRRFVVGVPDERYKDGDPDVILRVVEEESEENQEFDLEMVFILMRHGARTPVDIFPTDPNKPSDWPSPPGTLTNEGLRQHYRLGQFFRNRYINETGFLNRCYDSSQVYVRSTDYDRTISSALANVAGFFPPCANESSRWNPDLNWSPVAIHSQDKLTDLEMCYWKACDKLDQLIDFIFENDEEIEKFKKDNNETIQLVMEKSGWSKGFRSMWKVGDCLKAERENNMTWANWANDDILRVLLEIEILNFKVYSYNLTMQRFTGGNLLKDLNVKMEKMIKGESIEKMHIYSGHDTNVIALMEPLSLWNGKKVNYASYVALEMLKGRDDGKRFLRIYVRDDKDLSSNPNPQIVQLKFCDSKTFCPLEDYREFVKQFFVDDWKEECSVEPTIESEKKKIESLESTVTTLITILVIVVVSLILVVGFVIFKRRRRHSSTSSSRFS